MARAFQIETNLSPARRALFHDFWATFALLLFFATWKLWIAQPVFPQVPLFRLFVNVPREADPLLAGGVLLALLGFLLVPESSRISRRSLELFLVSLGLLLCFDQHRLQPWAYQFWLIALAARFLPSRHISFWWRWFTISIYFHSALSKFDLSFANELGQSFLTTALGLAGISIDSWSPAARQIGALFFPGWELAVAIALCFRPTRLWGLAGAWIMHVAMLVILGPWGMNHHAGVLLWNLFFICQAGLLFWPCRFQGPECPAETDLPATHHSGSRLTKGIYLVVMLAPFLQPWGCWDLWPSWGLYASHGERVGLWIDAADAEKLPPPVREHLLEIREEKSWRAFRLSRWSLAALHAPIYPQARFQLGVAKAILTKYELASRFRIHYEHAPRFPWTLQRPSEEYRNLRELDARMKRFRLNSEPRRGLFGP